MYLLIHVTQVWVSGWTGSSEGWLGLGGHWGFGERTTLGLVGGFEFYVNVFLLINRGMIKGDNHFVYSIFPDFVSEETNLVILSKLPVTPRSSRFDYSIIQNLTPINFPQILIRFCYYLIIYVNTNSYTN